MLSSPYNWCNLPLLFVDGSGSPNSARHVWHRQDMFHRWSRAGRLTRATLILACAVWTGSQDLVVEYTSRAMNIVVSDKWLDKVAGEIASHSLSSLGEGHRQRCGTPHKLSRPEHGASPISEILHPLGRCASVDEFMLIKSRITIDRTVDNSGRDSRECVGVSSRKPSVTSFIRSIRLVSKVCSDLLQWLPIAPKLESLCSPLAPITSVCKQNSSIQTAPLASC